MLLTALIKGFTIGFLIAAPVGPIGVLCIRRTLVQGRLFGFLSGLGAATADAVYGCLAGLGLTVITVFLVEQSHWLQLAGGLFLCYLGGRTLITLPAKETNEKLHGTRFGSYLSTFLLTMTNPVTILSFTAVFSGIGLTDVDYDVFSRLIVVFGVFCGSLVWWLILCNGVSFIKKIMLKDPPLIWIHRISGAVILAFGVYTLWDNLVQLK